MFPLLRLYIVEEAVLSCYQHSCLWLYAMILVWRLRKFPVSMIFALSKSITESLSHACFAMFEPLLCFLTFLMCSAFLVFRDLPVSPKYRQIF